MPRANILTNFAGFSPRKSLLREIYMLKTKSNEITDTHQAPCEAPETAEALRRSMWQAWLRSLLLFCCASVYVELCLHLCVYRSLDRRAVYLVLFGLLGGTVCTLLTTHLPKIARQIVGVLLVAVQVLFAEVQLMYHAIFGNFMPISQVSMGGNVITNFDSQILYSIGKNIVPILLLLVPLIVTILCLALRKLRVLTVRLKWRQALATLGILLTLLLATTGIMYAGRDKSFSVYKTFTNVNTSTDSSYKSVGMLATTVQELRYMVFGSSGSVIITPSSLGTDTRRLYSSNSYNVIESIDFAKLAESADNIMCRTTDEYLAQVVPTRKNNYTGLLQDYNLITICAESFCPWFISEELTPTLYKLSHTGIIFENYYGTFQSVTTNGEYTMCMGLYPDMSRTKTDSSFNVAGTNYLPFCLGNALKEKGYQTWGYHDYIGDFYNRNITHANMGYTFKAADSGLDIKIDWPSSDLEMMEASVDDYLNSKTPFHAYYMTFSGHYQYNWDNAMSAKNHDAVKDLPYSEPVKAYIACNLELENALTYLMDRLEQAGDIARRRFALDIRIGGQNDLVDILLADAGQQLADADILRPDALHRGDGAVQHVIAALEIAHALHGGHVARVAYHADHAVVAALIGTDRAGVFHRVVAADRAVFYRLAALPDGAGQLVHLILREGDDVIRQPLRGFCADAGQAGELLRHPRDGFNLPGHD